MKNVYCHLPERKLFCKAMSDSRFQLISYDPLNPGVTNRIDKDSDDLTSGILICACHPTLEIIPITKKEYYQMYWQILKGPQN